MRERDHFIILLKESYGFVQYDSDEGAQQAIEKLNGMLLNDKEVYVGPFLRKQEREMAMDKTKFTNVFVKKNTVRISPFSPWTFFLYIPNSQTGMGTDSLENFHPTYHRRWRR